MADARYVFDLDRTALGQVLGGPGGLLIRQVARLTRRIAAEAKIRSPVLTGNLARSIEEDPIRMVGPFRAESGVTARANYARFVHEGTRPHVIRPRVASVLRFKVGSQVVFARSVNHPGTRARPFLRNAADKVMGEPMSQ